MDALLTSIVLLSGTALMFGVYYFRHRNAECIVAPQSTGEPWTDRETALYSFLEKNYGRCTAKEAATQCGTKYFAKQAYKGLLKKGVKIEYVVTQINHTHVGSYILN